MQDASETYQEGLEAAAALAESYRYEREHAQHVRKLALMLFDALQPLHGLGDEDRFILAAAALLHDVGRPLSRQGHHKISAQIIMEDNTLPTSPEQRVLIALVARYHRRGLPKDKHDLYGDLPNEQQQRVDALAALLRLADGLDRAHISAVKSVECAITPDAVLVHAQATNPALPEQAGAALKADLFEQVFHRAVRLEVDFPPAS